MAGTESGRTEQIIINFFLKVLQVVLDSRVPHLLAGSRAGGDQARKRDRWFNLSLGDPPAALESLGLWHRSVADPMVVDVLLLRDAADSESVLERWTVHYEPSSSSPSSTRPSTPSSPFRAATASSSSSAEAAAAFYKRTYKKCVVLLRSVYALLRLLPAYKAFRMLSAATLKNLHPHRHNQNQNCNFNLSYRVSSFAEPFTRAEEDEMKHYDFAAVETQFGQITVSVVYRHDLSEFNLESSSLFPPRIIADYVGSPAAAGPSRAFPSSLPSSEGFVQPTSSPARGILRFGSGPISRPHSWTSTPMAHHPLSGSQLSASELHTSPMGVFGQRIIGGHQQLGSSRKGSTSFNEYPLSPPFSPSPSPSPPTHSGNPLHRRLQSETAPVTIPLPVTGSNPVYSCAPNLSDPSRSSLPPPSPRVARADNSSEDSPEIRSFRRVEGFKLSEISPSLPSSLQKGIRDARDDSGRFSGALSSCGGSPRVGFSRSSSKLSFQDDLDDSCPFAVDDVDVPDSQRRAADGKAASENQQASSSVSSWTSQGAAVGMLVHMLRTAPPLRQDQSYSSRAAGSGLDREGGGGGGGGGGASSFYAARRAADALEELRSYKEIKDMLLSRSGSHLPGPSRDR